MEYKLKLNKPHHYLKGSEHGKIQALTDIYNFIINRPTGDLSPKSIRDEIQKNLVKLGCTNLEVKGYPDYIDPEYVDVTRFYDKWLYTFYALYLFRYLFTCILL